jgi:hypothetical protein
MKDNLQSEITISRKTARDALVVIEGSTQSASHKDSSKLLNKLAKHVNNDNVVVR